MGGSAAGGLEILVVIPKVARDNLAAQANAAYRDGANLGARAGRPVKIPNIGTYPRKFSVRSRHRERTVVHSMLCWLGQAGPRQFYRGPIKIRLSDEIHLVGPTAFSDRSNLRRGTSD